MRLQIPAEEVYNKLNNIEDLVEEPYGFSGDKEPWQRTATAKEQVSLTFNSESVFLQYPFEMSTLYAERDQDYYSLTVELIARCKLKGINKLLKESFNESHFIPNNKHGAGYILDENPTIEGVGLVPNILIDYNRDERAYQIIIGKCGTIKRTLTSFEDLQENLETLETTANRFIECASKLKKTKYDPQVPVFLIL